MRGYWPCWILIFTYCVDRREDTPPVWAHLSQTLFWKIRHRICTRNCHGGCRRCSGPSSRMSRRARSGRWGCSWSTGCLCYRSGLGTCSYRFQPDTPETSKSSARSSQISWYETPAPLEYNKAANRIMPSFSCRTRRICIYSLSQTARPRSSVSNFW